MKSKFTILVCGSKGQLGSAMKAESKSSVHRFVFTDMDEMDISSEESVEANFAKYRPDVLVNCAAYTAVDQAEDEHLMAELVNAKSVQILAEACYKNNVFMVHVSTDYVFDGRNFKPYTEEDNTNPLSVYGYTKLQGERNMILSGCNGAVIRTSWLYSAYGNNFVKTILKHAALKDQLSVIFDQIGTPTYANDLVIAILAMIDRHISMELVSVYHFSNEGVASWYDFAQTIVEMSGINCTVMPIKSEEYPVKAQRPFYSVMDKSKIKSDLQIVIPYWRDSLEKCIKELNGNEHS